MRFSVLGCLASSIMAVTLTAGCSSHAPRQLGTSSQLQLAEVADAQGNTDMALSMYQAAAARGGDDMSAQLRYADALARAGKVKQAQRVLTQQLQRHPNQREVARASAVVDIISGNAPEAIVKLDRLLSITPRDESALIDKGIALDLLGRHADAQVLYRQALAISPNDVAGKNNLALSLMLQGRRQEAQNVLEEIGDPNDAPTRVKTNLGILYAANGDISRAQEITDGQINLDDLKALGKELRTASPISDR